MGLLLSSCDGVGRERVKASCTRAVSALLLLASCSPQDRSPQDRYIKRSVARAKADALVLWHKMKDAYYRDAATLVRSR